MLITGQLADRQVILVPSRSNVICALYARSYQLCEMKIHALKLKT